MAFTKFFSNEALRIASDIRYRILGTYVDYYGVDIINPEDALDIDESFVKLAYKPNQWTILHSFVQNYLIAEWHYAYRKLDDDFAPYALSILAQHSIYPTSFSNENRDYDWFLFEQLKIVSRRVAHEVFCVLFEDRELMRSFSIFISRFIESLCQSDYPAFLEKDGQIKRYSNWNVWLKEALFNRENGRCAICKCDLTGVIALGKKIHIDHIIPISSGGTNDPTNLQILCDDCNLKKGNRNTETGVLRQVLWDIDG